nr:DUF1254 domain-containing protein [Marinicella sp. W31]MDC2878753.1 DUF1254 domain-containing protein [Marinicella sp. W31]
MARQVLARIAPAAVAVALATTAFAQVSQQTLDAISTPDKVETPVGTFGFFDGVPTDASVAALYDNLDRMRAVEVFLNNQGAASLAFMRSGNAEIGANRSNKITISENLLDSTSLYLTGNTSTLYALGYLDLKADGPLVVELPPGMLGFFDDAWFRYVEDLGLVGPDKGKGGKYLLLPPGHDGTIPDGYFVVHTPTYNNLLFLRGSIADGLASAVENIKTKLKVYPLSKMDDPDETEFINFSGMSYNTVAPSDLSFFEGLNTVVQEEPIDAIGAETRGLLASIGIVKGKPFQPNDRMKKLLSEAAAIGDATARAITYNPRMKGAFIYPDSDSSWVMGYANKDVFLTSTAPAISTRERCFISIILA